MTEGTVFRPIPIFIGFDPRETVAWHVLCHSILARSSRPVSFVPLALEHLREQHPAIALAVLRNVSRALAERLRNTTRAITHLTT